MDPVKNSEVEIPSYFQCPVSMRLMRDPVTVCTGVTYDRESIEKWIYTLEKNTCPATMQVLQNHELTPNHTLRRLIQQWCVANSSKGVERMPTPPPPLDADQLAKLLRDIHCSPAPPFQVKALKKLRSLAGESESNRRYIVASAAPAALVAVVESQREETDQTAFYESEAACEEVLGVLYSLPLPAETIESLATARCLQSVAWILKRGTSNSRFHAVMLLQTASRNVLERFVMNINGDLIEGLLELLTEEVCHQATVAALELLTAISFKRGRHRIKAIQAGAISVLIELLPHQIHRRTREATLCLIDILCACAEGRAAMVDHAMGIPAVCETVMSVSGFATEKAVRILWSLCKFSPTSRVLKDMLQTGAVGKLCALLQSESTLKAKKKAEEMFELHGKFWQRSACAPFIIHPLRQRRFA